MGVEVQPGVVAPSWLKETEERRMMVCCGGGAMASEVQKPVEEEERACVGFPCLHSKQYSTNFFSLLNVGFAFFSVCLRIVAHGVAWPCVVWCGVV